MTTIAAIEPRTKIVGANHTDVQISANPWNQPRIVTGGAAGGVFVRDTAQSDGWGLVDAVATGSVLASAGAATPPVWSVSPTLTSLTLQTTGPVKLGFNDLSQPANTRRFRIFNANQEFSVEAVDDAEAVLHAKSLKLTRAGDGYIWRDIYEKQRTTALGHWMDVPYNAANFTVVPSGTWTVPSGSISTYAYCLIGKTMVLAFYAVNTTVSGSPTQLRVSIPAGMTATREFRTAAIFNDAGTDTTGILGISAGATSVYVGKLQTAAFIAGTSHVFFSLSFQVN
jgi:hypothetical protein